MGEILLKHKIHWASRAFYISTLWALVLFTVSVAISTMTSKYATIRATNPVTDIVLSNIRVFDVDVLVNYGPLLILILIILILFFRPSAIPFTIKSIALFIVIRAVFISLTHIGQFEPQIALPSTGFLNFIGGGNTGGLFFSGHTGVPFLLSLIFWDNKILRLTFIAISIVLGTSMLLGHLHYTIDVVGAFFITPTIYYLAQKLFKRDYELLHKGIS